MARSLESIHDAFAAHAKFDREADRYRVTSTPFDIAVRFTSRGEERVAYTVEGILPSLDAVVADETISDTLLDGWAEPMERRLRDAHHATAISSADVTCTWNRDEFHVDIRFARAASAPAPVEAVIALAGYIEGTYVQGVVPGYTYRSPVDELLAAAQDRATEID